MKKSSVIIFLLFFSAVSSFSQISNWKYHLDPGSLFFTINPQLGDIFIQENRINIYKGDRHWTLSHFGERLNSQKVVLTQTAAIVNGFGKVFRREINGETVQLVTLPMVSQLITYFQETLPMTMNGRCWETV